MIKTKWTYYLLAFVLIANLIVAYTSDENFKGEVSFALAYSASDIFTEIRDLDNKPLYRTEIDSIIVLSKKGSLISSWKEVHKNDHVESFEYTAYIPDSLLVFKTIESSRGLKGEWTYRYDEVSSIMFIQEISTADTFFYKWVYTIIGRDAVLNKLRETLINQLGKKSKETF